MKTSDITVITLHGASGSGKDSTYLQLRRINPMLPRFSYGDLLREEVYRSYQLSPESVGDEREVKTYFSPLRGQLVPMSFKDVMIEWGRLQILRDPFHYAKHGVQSITNLAIDYDNPLVVVTDCRRYQELYSLRESFKVYSFRLYYGGSTEKPLDNILLTEPGIVGLGKGNTIQGNAEQIIDFMVRNMPRTPKLKSEYPQPGR